MVENHDRYDWVETVVKAGQLIGLNPVRTRWRLRAWQDRMRGKGAGLSVKAAAVTRAHKLCPECGTINAMDARVCLKCGASLHSRPVDMLLRFSRHFNLGLSAETFIALALIAVYVTVGVTGRGGFMSFTTPDLLWLGGNYPPATMSGEWWRLWTSVFLHAGLWHLGFNAYALIYITPMAREVYGTGKTLFVFCLTGIGASLTSVVYGRLTGNYGVSIGASGAISGIIGLMLVWGWREGTTAGINIRNNMARWVLYTLAFGFFMNADNAAHAGGWLLGGALALTLPTKFVRSEKRTWQVIGVICGLAIAAAVGLIIYLALFTPSPPLAPRP